MKLRDNINFNAPTQANRNIFLHVSAIAKIRIPATKQFKFEKKILRRLVIKQNCLQLLFNNA